MGAGRRAYGEEAGLGVAAVPCRTARWQLAGSSRGTTGCGVHKWSLVPDGKWIYLTTNASGGYHIWRQRFPDGKPEQINWAATEEEGVTVAADGRSLITAVGTGALPLQFATERGSESSSRKDVRDWPRPTRLAVLT